MLSKNVFLGALLAMSGHLTGSMGMRAPVMLNERRFGAKFTRSRIEGRARKGGAKLEKRALCGTLTLKNTSKGGYGENLREAMNKRNTGFYSRT